MLHGGRVSTETAVHLALYRALPERFPTVLAAIRETKDLSKETEAQLAAALETFTKEFNEKA